MPQKCQKGAKLTPMSRRSNLHRMWSFRLVCALVLAVSLVILPVSAAFAALHAASVQADMMGSADDCPCCKRKHMDTCLFKCWQLQALIVRGAEVTNPAPVRFGETAAHRFAAFDFGPDPPPPRS
jgi:hypothetical protein